MEHNILPQNATLSPNQATAIEALLAGKTVTDAADMAGVARETVHRWLKEDFVFQAELNRERRELQERMRARLMLLAEKATGCVEKAVDGGDEKTALAVLKGLGLLGREATPIGSDNPAELENDMRHREALLVWVR